jgi:hypothetical protein
MCARSTGLPQHPSRGNLEAAARVARGGAYGATVVLARQPGLVALARRIGRHSGVGVTVEIQARTIAVRFVQPARGGRPRPPVQPPAVRWLRYRTTHRRGRTARPTL